MTATAANAQLPEGFYLGAGAGATFTPDYDLRLPTAPPGTQDPTNLNHQNPSVAVGAAIGYRFPSGLRTELELSYRVSNIDSGQAPGATFVLEGETKAFTGMVNVLYDLDLGGIAPYLGVGVGAGRFRIDNLFSLPPIGPIFSEDSWAFAFQGIAGVSVALSDQIELFADYRYMRTVGLDIDGNFQPSPPGVYAKTGDEYSVHTAMAGIRFYLDAPAAPMPVAAPEPAPEPAMVPRNFLVFFEWDRSDLTPEAKGIIADAAAYAAQGGISRIHLTGHTDTSGAADYNVGLSQRRAESVKTELTTVHQMNPDAISTAWRGESDPLVATGDGVREPQNRRVEIVFP